MPSIYCLGIHRRTNCLGYIIKRFQNEGIRMDTIQDYKEKRQNELRDALSDYYRNGAYELARRIQKALTQYRKTVVYISKQDKL